MNHTPIVLAILDGWGMSSAWGGNAISMESPRTMNYLWRNYPHAILQAFRPVAGNFKIVGNSEIGHSSIGAGKIVFQDLERISKSITDKTFFHNPVLVDTVRSAIAYNSSIHLIGLVSDGGIHSHINHLFALLKLAKFQNAQKVYIHIITDGVDADSTAGLGFVRQVEKFIAEIGIGEIATICGRNFAMDRSNNWQNIAKVMDALINGVGQKANSPVSAISDAYKIEITDQFIPPTVIFKNNNPVTKINDNDSLIFFNFRPDRAQELSLALLGMHQFGSKISPPANLHLAAFTSYYLPPTIQEKIKVAFPAEKIDSTLGRIISRADLKQFRIAESEKQPHISYFFDCGNDEILPGEERVFINSPQIKNTFAEKPEMSIKTLNAKLIEAIKSKKYHFILVNFANVDSVGHSGDLSATTKAVHFVDEAIKEISAAVLEVDGTLIVTADHGNAEQMLQVKSKDRETFHSLNPVPFILIRADLLSKNHQPISGGEILANLISSKNTLADIAPTILELLDLQKPPSMTGKSLLSDIIKE